MASGPYGVGMALQVSFQNWQASSQLGFLPSGMTVMFWLIPLISCLLPRSMALSKNGVLIEYTGSCDASVALGAWRHCTSRSLTHYAARLTLADVLDGWLDKVVMVANLADAGRGCEGDADRGEEEEEVHRAVPGDGDGRWESGERVGSTSEERVLQDVG